MRLILLTLALVLTGAAPLPDWGTARDVEVRLSSFAFTPPRIELRAGEPVRLELVNDLLATRSFHAPRFFTAAQVLPADRPRLSGGALHLRPGERRTIRLVAPVAGKYHLRSGRLIQAALGMRGTIVVR